MTRARALQRSLRRSEESAYARLFSEDTVLYTPEAQSAYRWRQDVRYADQEEGGDNGDWYGEEEEEAEGCDDGGEACHPQTDPSPSPDDPSSFPEVWKEDGGGI